MAEFSGAPRGEGRRFAVVGSRFNQEITTRLVEGAMSCLVKHGAKLDDVDLLWVPGAWELPAAIERLLGSERYDAIVAVGAVIRGETAHFDYVAGPCAAGVAQVGLDTGVPVVFGVLTTDTDQQALDRAGGCAGNKGEEAAQTAVEMVSLLRVLTNGGTD